MMVIEIDMPSLPLIKFIIGEKSWKNQALPRDCWKNCENVLALVNEIQANFLLITKRLNIQEMLNCVVYSSFDVCVIQ